MVGDTGKNEISRGAPGMNAGVLFMVRVPKSFEPPFIAESNAHAWQPYFPGFESLGTVAEKVATKLLAEPVNDVSLVLPSCQVISSGLARW